MPQAGRSPFHSRSRCEPCTPLPAPPSRASRPARVSSLSAISSAATAMTSECFTRSPPARERSRPAQPPERLVSVALTAQSRGVLYAISPPDAVFPERRGTRSPSARRRLRLAPLSPHPDGVFAVDVMIAGCWLTRRSGRRARLVTIPCRLAGVFVVDVMISGCLRPHRSGRPPTSHWARSCSCRLHRSLSCGLAMAVSPFRQASRPAVGRPTMR